MSKKQYQILIIDDEENIGKALQSTLKDKYQVIVCQESTSWQKLYTPQIDLILLDLWMPKKDGVMVMKEIREINPVVPIIVMSGHANISTTVELFKKGANDFIEKPFQHHQLIQKLNTLLHDEENISLSSQAKVSPLIKKSGEKQKTIASSTVLTGKGLHRGNNTGLIFLPAPPDSGIIFENIASEQKLEAHIENIAETNLYATTLKKGEFSLTVVEHLLSALHMYGVDNIHIKVSEEIPIFDGSAITFCKTLEEVGVIEQDAFKKILQIDKDYILYDEKNSNIWIKFEPQDHLSISYTLDFPHKFGKQQYEVDFKEDHLKTFVSEIAPCRTFGFLDEIKKLYNYGLAKGSDLKTGILIDKDQVINTELLFPNEFARHKVLDIIGDLYLSGCAFRGRVTGHLSGHRHTTQLQKQILNI